MILQKLELNELNLISKDEEFLFLSKFDHSLNILPCEHLLENRQDESRIVPTLKGQYLLFDHQDLI